MMSELSEALLSWRVLPLYAILIAAVAVHLRGQVRHRSFLRQLTDHSTFMAPYNGLMYLFSGVPNTPVLDVGLFPELAPLRENWRTIRDEAAALYDAGSIKASDKYDDIGFNSFFRSGWKRFYLKWYDDFLPSAEELCPKTVELLRAIPSVNAAMFTSMDPRSKLITHRDPFAGSLRYHLGLITPNSERCRISVDGTRLVWRDGEDMMFDETYIHSPVNDTDKRRIILFCDVMRPMRFGPAAALNRFVVKRLVKAGATRNVEGEKVGLLNRAFGYAHHTRAVAKKFERANKPLYYLTKYALFAGLAYLIFFA